ncbi:DAB adaptor protein 1 [Rhinolophus ferrumequinum]|uniref:DAB adaptor protein 1 n=1 Tax=Rhinolophus ferrumequinum TaxID=59479 RepID=A0A7J7X3Q3_RHIFE|nr:DAB adaptor protein 1 [Rhinolophus ferrumequinum]
MSTETELQVAVKTSTKKDSRKKEQLRKIRFRFIPALDRALCLGLSSDL